jgi:hypothetical protein
MPRAGGTAQGTAYGPSGRLEGTAGHRSKVVPGLHDGPVAGLYFLFKKISMLPFLPSHLGWMDEPTDLHFFKKLTDYIFY